MILTFLRDRFAAGFTLGQLFIDGKKTCHTLEDAVREVPGRPVEEWKIKGQTAIPAGRYRVLITPSQRFGRPMLQLMDVPGFTGIRVHGGNNASHVEGCIAVGEERTFEGVRRCSVVLAEIERRVQAAIDAGIEVYAEVE